MITSIELTDRDKFLLDDINFDVASIRDNETSQANLEKIGLLAESLLGRKAIPPHRLDVFCSEKFAIGRGKSPYAQFKANRHDDSSMLRHPHFARWLQYFIYGPKLPQGLIEAFAEKIDELGDITSGDYKTLLTFIRALVREYKLRKSQVEELFKLVLELENDVYLAHAIYRDARKVARDF